MGNVEQVVSEVAQVGTSPEKVLVLRTCTKDMASPQRRHFIWPREGVVRAPDWSPVAECGHGLHGWLWGEGDGAHACWDVDANWLVLEVMAKDVVDLQGKVKFPECTVLFVGPRHEATQFLAARAPGKKIIGATISAGDRGTASAGDRGTASAGYCGTASAGDRGTASAGYGGTASAGECGTASAGDRGTASAGYGGTASAGECGTASAGECGTASAGDRGTASAGDRGTASAGECGLLSIKYWDPKRQKYRVACAEVGEDGIEPKTAYVLDASFKFVKKDGGVE